MAEFEVWSLRHKNPGRKTPQPRSRVANGFRQKPQKNYKVFEVVKKPYHCGGSDKLLEKVQFAPRWLVRKIEVSDVRKNKRDARRARIAEMDGGK